MLRVFLLALLLPVSITASEVNLDSYVQAEMELNGIPGLSLLVVEDGAVSHMKAYGIRSVATGEAMTAETPVELASVSKSLTALAIVRLEREGVVDRDSPVGLYLPELNKAGWAGVTLRHLLQHRSGLRRRHDFRVPCCGQEGEFDLHLAAEKLAGARLASPPGGTFFYANSNYILLAAVVERVSGVSFLTFMREKIFLPLGMHRSTVDEAQARSWGRADPHEWQWGRVRVSPSRFFGWYGASLVKSSAADMGGYLTYLLNPQRIEARPRILAPRWWEDLEQDYDLGWFVRRETSWLDGDLALEHAGDIWGGNTAALLAPRRRAAVAVLTNLGTNRANRIARAILRSLDGAELPQPAPMSRAEIPDVWARTFIGATAVLLLAMGAYGFRVRRQLRQDARQWQPNGWRIARAAFLTGLAIIVIYTAFGGVGPPWVSFPTTVRVALPLLVVTVAGLLLFAAALGLTVQRRP